MCTRNFIFPIKQEDISDYSTLCFMSSGLMLDKIIMNLFTDSIEQTTDSVHKHLKKNKDDTIHLYKGSLQDFTRKRKNDDAKKTLRSHHFIE